MTYDYHVWADGQRWGYDIYDLDDVIEYEGSLLPELVEQSNKTWTNEETAERNAVKRIKQLESKK